MIIQILCLNNLTSIPIQATGSYKAFAGKMFIFIIQAQAALKTTLLRKPGRHKHMSEYDTPHKPCHLSISHALDDTQNLCMIIIKQNVSLIFNM